MEEKERELKNYTHVVEVESQMIWDNLVQKCNELLFDHMYPQGKLEKGSFQHRDLVRTFFAAAFDTLLIIHKPEICKALIENYREMCGHGWLPGENFRL